MKMTITALALSAASSSAFALQALPLPTEIKTKNVCLNVYQDSQGVSFAASCDSSKNNEIAQVTLLSNGCAEGQVALTATSINGKFDIFVKSCMRPNIAQL